MRLLNNYLSKNTHPLISSYVKGKMEHCAWYLLYNNEKEAEKNFIKYLNSPPQLLHEKKSLEYESQKLPIIEDTKQGVIVRKMGIKKMDDIDITLSRDYGFPVVCSDNFDPKDFSV